MVREHVYRWIEANQHAKGFTVFCHVSLARRRLEKKKVNKPPLPPPPPTKTPEKQHENWLHEPVTTERATDPQLRLRASSPSRKPTLSFSLISHLCLHTGNTVSSDIYAFSSNLGQEFLQGSHLCHPPLFPTTESPLIIHPLKRFLILPGRNHHAHLYVPNAYCLNSYLEHLFHAN